MQPIVIYTARHAIIGMAANGTPLMDTERREALDLLERALRLMDAHDMPLVAARIASAIDDLVGSVPARSTRLH